MSKHLNLKTTRFGSRLWRWPLYLLEVLVLAWVISVFVYSPIWSGWRLGVMALGAAGAAFVSWNWRFSWRSMLAATGFIWSIAATCLWTLKPDNDRDWVVEQSLLPDIKFAEERQKVTINNFRDFRYSRSIPTQTAYQKFEFDLQQIRRAWFVVQYFADAEFIAHTMLCFEIHPDPNSIAPDEQSRFFAVSIEVRREREERFGVLKGIFRNYEITYVVGDERDLLGKRIVDRPGDRVYLYGVNAEPTQLQDFFCKIAARIEELKHQPEFYHTLLNNCTNNIAFHVNQLRRAPLDTGSLRMILSGFSDRLAFESHLIGRPGETFEELKTRSRVDPLGKHLSLDESFSLKLRRILAQQSR